MNDASGATPVEPSFAYSFQRFLDWSTPGELASIVAPPAGDPLSGVAVAMVAAGVSLLAVTASIRLWDRWVIHNKP